jgi:hypothetical protein
MIQEKNKVKKEQYDEIYEYIISDKISPRETAEYLDDMDFYKYYTKRRTMGSLWQKK